MPKNFPHDYDAHIYFSDDQYNHIKLLKEKLGQSFSGPEIFIGDIIPEAIGPHTQPMLEVNFSIKLFSEIVPWLSVHRQDLNILVHPQTTDHYYDHTQMAIWLGHPVLLKLNVFK